MSVSSAAQVMTACVCFLTVNIGDQNEDEGDRERIHRRMRKEIRESREQRQEVHTYLLSSRQSFLVAECPSLPEV